MNDFGNIPQEPQLSDDRLNVRRTHLVQLLSEESNDNPVDVVSTPEGKAKRNLHFKRRAIAGAVVAASVAAILGVGSTHLSNGNTKTHVQAAIAPTADINNPQLLLADVQKAITATNVIVHVVQTTTSADAKHVQVSEMWMDQGAPNGFRDIEYNGTDTSKPAVDDGSYSKDGIVYTRDVDYSAKTVGNSQHPLEGNQATSNPNPGYGTLTDDTVLGHDTINGNDTIHLSNPEPGMNRELWIDPQTKLPVRMTAHGTWGSYVMNYDWIPRNDQTVASIMLPTAPAGFTAVTLPTVSASGAAAKKSVQG